MEMKSLNLKNNPFELPSPYNLDVWNVIDWDFYKNSSSGAKAAWKVRTNVMNNSVNFLLCNNNYIREEIKYFTFLLLTEKKISLRTFAEYMDRYKILFEFLNTHKYQSILDVNTNEFSKYVVKTGHKSIIENGKTLKGKGYTVSARRNRIITSLDFIKKTLFIYHEKDIPIYERDIWRSYELSMNQTGGKRNMVFSDIVQNHIKVNYKEFCRMKLEVCEFTTVYDTLNSLKIFSRWLNEFDAGLVSISQISRDILEEYFMFLRIESDFSQNLTNKCILDLKTFIEYGIMAGFSHFTNKCLITNNDYCFKTKKESKFFTDSEIKSIISLIPKIDRVYGMIIYSLIMIGCRISEVLKLKKDMLLEENNTYKLSIYMYKTDRYSYVPINNNLATMLLNQIKANEKKYGYCEYIFVNSNNLPINYHTFRLNIFKAIIENDIRDDNGVLLDFKSHRFRATKATKLINMGFGAKETADLLGQKGIDSLSYYVTATNGELKEMMKQRIKKESILIDNIGKIDDLAIEEYSQAIPLCNGWCCRSPHLGICEKANACLSCSQFKPSKEFLNMYYTQLQEIEASIVIASSNGYQRLLEKNLMDKEIIVNIINKLEGKKNE